jgi:hypothetical protein
VVTAASTVRVGIKDRVAGGGSASGFRLQRVSGKATVASTIDLGINRHAAGGGRLAALW